MINQTYEQIPGDMRSPARALSKTDQYLDNPNLYTGETIDKIKEVLKGKIEAIAKAYQK